METKKGGKWTPEQRQAARDRWTPEMKRDARYKALMHHHRDKLIPIIRMLSKLNPEQRDRAEAELRRIHNREVI